MDGSGPSGGEKPEVSVHDLLGEVEAPLSEGTQGARNICRRLAVVQTLCLPNLISSSQRPYLREAIAPPNPQIRGLRSERLSGMPRGAKLMREAMCTQARLTRHLVT